MNAEDRAWQVVRRAFEERSPQPRPRGRLVLATAAAALAVAVTAAVSPPGRAVFHHVRQAVGLADADPALFSLPAQGRLLVVSADGGGVWLVRADGYLRKLGAYDDAVWSPHGRFVAATEGNRLVAFDPYGGVRWTLARSRPSWPAWEGTATDTRIAYVAASGLRVVAGDGTGDRLLDRFGGGVPPAWDPARLHVLAYYSGGAILLRRADGTLLWRSPVTVTPSSLSWSSDGALLAVFSAKKVVVLDRHGTLRRTVSMLGAELLTGAFRPGTHELAVEVRRPGHSDLRLVDVDRPGNARVLFAGPGDFGDLAWAPDGSWLLVTWPAADQWVFIRGTRAHAVGHIAEQFPRGDGKGPLLLLSGRWCCSR